MSRKELIAALHALEPALRDLEATIGASEGGGGGPGGGGDRFIPQAGKAKQPSGGGKPVAAPDGDEEEGGLGVGGVLAAARAHPVVAALATVAAVAGPPVGAGLISASRGGDFSAGALSQINQQIASIPLLGELSGIAGGVRVEQAVGGVAQQIAEVEARGGEVSDAFRTALLRESFEIESRREKSLQRSQVEIEQLAEAGATGQNRFEAKHLLAFGGIGAVVFTADQVLESLGVELFK